MLLLSLLCASVSVAHAADLDATYAQWKTLRDTEAVLPDFSTAAAFLQQHPGWPQEKVIRTRAEAAALLQRPQRLANFCTDFPPITGRGMIACLASGAVGDSKQRLQWLHDGWVNGDFSEDDEQRILAAYGKTLKPAEHLARLDRLLYEGKTAAAKRMYPLVTPPYRQLSDARIALMTGARNAIAKLQNVPSALRNHPGLVLSRIEWRAKNGLDDGVVEMFLAAPANPPYADRWWNLRASAVRQALRDRNYDAALKILARHGDLNAENLADALFLEGWIRMEYKRDPRAGYRDFYALYKTVATPVSKARAAYWAGRAATRNGNADIAEQWYGIAAKHPSVFYGQLAQQARDGKASLDIPPMPTVSEATQQALDTNEVAQMALRLPEGDRRLMWPLFLKALTDRAASPEEFAAIADMGKQLGGTYGAVKVAKWALRQQVMLSAAGWPNIALPDNLAVEPALTLAIARQESEFNPTARSSADARGLMQLLPGTGAHEAKKMGITFSASDLWEPERNLTLGSHYLGQLVDGFDGSYILAIASYNAGPATVRKWLAREGLPPHDAAGAINWIESIPYAETRNYVMRVLENLQIYRELRNPEQPLDIIHDITR